MSVKIKYKGNEIAEIIGSGEKTLSTSGKYLEDNITIENLSNESDECNHTIYTGDYHITPSVNAQILETRNKLCEDDIEIASIPYFEVDNLQNGKTIIIGG